MNEEPFGPLALVNPVKTLDEAIEKANSLPYGLAGYAFTRSAGNADRLAENLEVGNLSINHFVASVAETPFGGVKDSGYGREGGTEGLQGYTIAKNVSHKMMSVASMPLRTLAMQSNTPRHRDGSAGDANYGVIGERYAQFRRPDPRIAAPSIEKALAGARKRS